MKFSNPIRRILRRTAALLIAAVLAIPALAAGAGGTAAAPMTGRRSFDALSSASELFQSEITLSLEEIKAREESDEYIPHVWPVRLGEFGYISSYYGIRIDPVTGESSEFHYAIDLADKPNTKIHAAASGVVVEAMDYGGYGLTILIDHGNGYQSRYSHCNSMLVSEGDTVCQGQVIATMGATGRATGVHCDFRIYLNGDPIDPLTVLDEPEEG